MSLIHVLASRLTYANVVSSIALFVALGGGAYALNVPKNSVGASELRKGAVTASKVRRHSLTARAFKPGVLPALGGAQAPDSDPSPLQATVIESAGLKLRSAGRAFVLGTLRDSFLTCGATPCVGHWGIYVDGRPVPATGMLLKADVDGSDGHGFYTLYGITERLRRGDHTVTLGLTTDGAPVSAGQLGAQLGALTLGG
jgi:hypothetical protein